MVIAAYEVRPDEISYLKQLEVREDCTISLHPEGLTPEAIPELPEGCAVSVLGMHHYGPAELQAMAARGVCALSTRTVGYNHIDLEAARACGIPVCNARYDPNGVADYTVMMILLCLRNYKQALWRLQVNDYSLGGLMGRQLKDLTVGVIGTGRIGAQVIRNLSGFGCRVLAHDTQINESIQGMAEYVPLDELYRRSDVITLHVPLLLETWHMINDKSLSLMKDGVVLINCARGDLMDINALIHGIETEKIGALGLDVLESEEGIVHKDRKTDIFSNREMAYLRQFKNVVYTPHMAFYTDTAVAQMVECGILGCLRLARGEACPTRLV